MSLFEWLRLPKLRLRTLALLAVLATMPGLAASTEGLGLNDSRIGSPAARADEALRDARELPDAALERLQQLLREAPVDSDEVRMLARLRLQVLISAGRLDGMEEAILDWEQAGNAADDLVRGHARLLRGLLAERQAKPGLALSELRLGMDGLLAVCPAASSLRLATPDADSGPQTAPLLQEFPQCDYRAISYALRLRERLHLARGALAEARADTLARLDLVRAAGDLARTAEAWAMLAHLAARDGESTADVDRFEALARTSGTRLDDPSLEAQLLLMESATAAFRGLPERVLQSSSAALVKARSAGLPRLEVRAMNNMADARLRLGQPAEALRESERALLLAREIGDLQVQQTLLINAGVARIALGQLVQAKADRVEAEALLDQIGGDGERALLLREFGEAYAAAGEAASALELFHRERQLSARIVRQNIESALREVEVGFDAELRQRQLELLQSQLELSSSEIEARDLQLRIGFLATGVVLMLVFAGWALRRRLRSTRMSLIASRERLRVQSERDPLTGLANRRALARWLQEAGDAARGCLLLMDIDHFKQLNDRHGHAAGDAVLCELATRLSACVRDGDLLVRWGGEEFLLVARDLPPSRALALAQRLLAAAACSPVESGEAALDVRLSLGACCFDGTGESGTCTYEAALQIADLGLYAAKSRGRSRAVAMLGIAAGVDAAAVIDDFEGAERAGWADVQTVILH
ncbi:MAG: GGDEF domain-containing protein [Aquimonas sp.]|nr:GGDEF domain-containing protein [Aquimonas sp.]